MFFFNKSGYRGYVKGNIITPNLLYRIDRFEEQIIKFVRDLIVNEDVIITLNNMFCPITGNDESYPYECDRYEEFSFDKLNGNGLAIYNDEILDVTEFYDKYHKKTFGISDIVLLSSNIEYHETIKKKMIAVKDDNANSI